MKIPIIHLSINAWQTDRWMEGQTHPLLEMRERFKKHKKTGAWGRGGRKRKRERERFFIFSFILCLFNLKECKEKANFQISRFSKFTHCFRSSTFFCVLPFLFHDKKFTMGSWPSLLLILVSLFRCDYASLYVGLSVRTSICLTPIRKSMEIANLMR